MTNLMRVAMVCAAALFAGLSVGCDGNGPGPKTEQAIGVGAMGVGATVAPINPPLGIAIAAGGAALTVHAAHREESGGGK